jgi:hypothetical protein
MNNMDSSFPSKIGFYYIGKILNYRVFLVYQPNDKMGEHGFYVLSGLHILGCYPLVT